MRFISVATWSRPTSKPSREEVAQHPAAGERVVQMQFVDPQHQREIGGGNRSRADSRRCPG
jgi:hypothetical protein